MDEITAYCCGENCRKCEIYLATREKDDEKKHKWRVEIAQTIKSVYGIVMKPEEITDCDGCRAEEGKCFSKDCPIRKCAQKKDVESCPSCTEHPCEKIEKMSATEQEIT